MYAHTRWGGGIRPCELGLQEAHSQEVNGIDFAVKGTHNSGRLSLSLAQRCHSYYKQAHSNWQIPCPLDRTRGTRLSFVPSVICTLTAGMLVYGILKSNTKHSLTEHLALGENSARIIEYGFCSLLFDQKKSSVLLRFLPIGASICYIRHCVGKVTERLNSQCSVCR